MVLKSRGQAVLELLINMQNFVAINNSKTLWPTISKMLKPFVTFSDNLLQDAYLITFQTKC